MIYYLIICRSLTIAQRTASALERAGISAQIIRAPKHLQAEGCANAVKIAERRLTEALTALRRADLSPLRIYITSGDGSYREVFL